MRRRQGSNWLRQLLRWSLLWLLYSLLLLLILLLLLMVVLFVVVVVVVVVVVPVVVVFVVFVFVDDDIFIATETVVFCQIILFCQMKKEQSRAAALEALLEDERKSHKVFFILISWTGGQWQVSQLCFSYFSL